jgi:CRISPR/Cas system CSM-associated protein Csm3 (group 7 of RAMP superfamily)
MRGRYVTAVRTLWEAMSPLAVSSGACGEIFGEEIVRDAVGLPHVPGTSLAGALRAAFADAAEAKRLFGSPKTDGKKGGAETGESSPLHVGALYACDSESAPAIGDVVALNGRRKNDPLLRMLCERTLSRDRVRLSDKGTAKDGAKFTVSAVPTGTRFKGELLLWSDGIEEANDCAARLVSLLRSRDMALGGGKRAGLGRMEARKIETRRYDLADGEDYRAFATWRAAPFAENAEGFSEPSEEPTCPAAGRTTVGSKTLKAKDFFYVGGGAFPLAGKTFDIRNMLLPYSEDVVTWDKDRHAKTDRRVVLPGASIKGALRHRAEFHYRCAKGIWAGQDRDVRHMDALFGCVREEKGLPFEERTRAGCVFIDDVHIDAPACGTQTHIRIDRFSGGVVSGALFGEQALWQAEITIRWRVSSEVSGDHTAALEKALEDLAAGRLALGAASGRGHGYFEAA